MNFEPALRNDLSLLIGLGNVKTSKLPSRVLEREAIALMMYSGVFETFMGPRLLCAKRPFADLTKKGLLLILDQREDEDN